MKNNAWRDILAFILSDRYHVRPMEERDQGTIPLPVHRQGALLCSNWANQNRCIRVTIARLSAWSAVMAIMLASAQAAAGEIEPRAYVNTPVGINFLLAGYVYSDGGLSTAASSPVKDAQLTMHSGVLAYARTLDVWGKAGKFDVILPYSDLSGTAMVANQPRERKVSGFNDPRFRYSVNFYGAPALSLQEFANYQQDLIIGASVQVSAPLGQYDNDKLVNLGNHRWSVKPDLGISKAWGPVALELSTGVTFFSTNEEYFGGKTLEQDPLVTSQLHLTYNFSHGIWAALSGTYDYGGRTTLDEVRSDDGASNSRAGATLALPVNRNNSIKLYASTGVATKTGSDFDLAGILWQYRWGQGL
ncbi:transporter [uncultured Desulfobulbus sp.]|uniref:transporter n=1 Tax=uncultured Desulfobulbus sp. TaxID=239745 RepID=UPI0029C642F4|nr:transporter [uncultured Desulfobulbus sp.]